MRRLYLLLGFTIFALCSTGGSALAVSANVVGTGKASSCSQKALADALAAGGTITFNCGKGKATIAVTSVLHVTTDTTIDGGGRITLSGKGKSGIFEVDGRNPGTGISFTVKGIAFTGGRTADKGAAISSGWESSLTIDGCTFSKNVSNESTAGSLSAGAAVFFGSLHSASISNSTFTNNTGSNGGAIYNLNGTMTVSNSSFSGNRATATNGAGGGAIYSDNTTTGSVTIDKSTFKGSRSPLLGGALLVHDGGLSISNSSISGSRAGTNGGAIYHYDDGSHNTTLTISNTNIVQNTTGGQGGGIWIGGSSSATITNSAIIKNSATGKGSLGGGIAAAGAPFSLTNVTLAANKVPDKNGSGGAIAAPGVAFHLNNVTIAGNSAGFQGGAIFGGDASSTIDNSILSANIAKQGGNAWHGNVNCMTTFGGSHSIEYLANPDDNTPHCTNSPITTDPKLGSVTFVKGAPSSWVMIPKMGSPAIDSGAGCAANDQRGTSRPQGAACDIGAYEVVPKS